MVLKDQQIKELQSKLELKSRECDRLNLGLQKTLASKAKLEIKLGISKNECDRLNSELQKTLEAKKKLEGKLGKKEEHPGKQDKIASKKLHFGRFEEV